MNTDNFYVLERYFYREEEFESSVQGRPLLTAHECGSKANAEDVLKHEYDSLLNDLKNIYDSADILGFYSPQYKQATIYSFSGNLEKIVLCVALLI